MSSGWLGFARALYSDVGKVIYTKGMKSAFKLGLNYYFPNNYFYLSAILYKVCE